MEERIADFVQSDGPAMADVQRELSVMRGVDRRQSADRTTCVACGSPDTGRGTYDGSAGRLIAENTELARRVQRLSPVLVSMARDLAMALRENGALRRKTGSCTHASRSWIRHRPPRSWRRLWSLGAEPRARDCDWGKSRRRDPGALRRLRTHDPSRGHAARPRIPGRSVVPTLRAAAGATHDGTRRGTCGALVGPS